jgi:hypothetical protein
MGFLPAHPSEFLHALSRLGIECGSRSMLGPSHEMNSVSPYWASAEPAAEITTCW